MWPLRVASSAETGSNPSWTACSWFGVPGSSATKTFKPLSIAVLTVSDTRGEADDTSGAALVERLRDAGHRLAEKRIVGDDVYAIRAVVSAWIAADAVDTVIATGGTGVTGRDGTPEAVRPLLDNQVADQQKPAADGM